MHLLRWRSYIQFRVFIVRLIIGLPAHPCREFEINNSKINPQGLCHSPAIIRICIIAVINPTMLNLQACISHTTSRVGKKCQFLCGCHSPKKLAWLAIIVMVIFAKIITLNITSRLIRLEKSRLILPVAITVGLVVQLTSQIPIHPHQAIAMKAVILFYPFGVVYRDLVMINTQSIPMGISIGKKASLQHAIRRKTDPWNDAGRVKGCLLNFGKVVIRVAV